MDSQHPPPALSSPKPHSMPNAIAPDATFPYTYSGFCSAVTTWNTRNPSNQIFMGATDADRRAELAAFFGNIRHESDDLKVPRENYMCQTQTTVNGKLYCKPSGYWGGPYNDPYCSASHTSSSNPAGCDCSTIPESSVAAGYIDANLLFLGRGAMQLSWNYNYYYAGAALGVDLCTNPERVATDEEVNWGTAMWFWATNTGSTGTTCKEYVEAGSFGGTVKTIVSCFVGRMNGLICLVIFAFISNISLLYPQLFVICFLLHRTVDWNTQLQLVITTR